jgi:hypothetical protein
MNDIENKKAEYKALAELLARVSIGLVKMKKAERVAKDIKLANLEVALRAAGVSMDDLLKL